MSNTAPLPSRTYMGELVHFTLTWTPRTIVAGFSGYYCLGVAYEVGIMAAIDRIAMRMLRPSLGYMAMAAFMPTFQWYSAWGVRVVVGLSTSLVYYLIEKILGLIYNTLFPSPARDIVSTRTTIHDQHPDLEKALHLRKKNE